MWIDDQHKAVMLAALEHAQADMEHFWYKWRDGVKPSELRAIISAAIDEIAQLSAPAASGGGLLPCPFCGGTPYLIHIDGYRPTSPKTYRVTCVDDSCEVQTLEFDTEAEAIAAWNQRTPAPALPQALVPDEKEVSDA